MILAALDAIGVVCEHARMAIVFTLIAWVHGGLSGFYLAWWQSKALRADAKRMLEEARDEHKAAATPWLTRTRDQPSRELIEYGIEIAALEPVEADPTAPRSVPLLPSFWDVRRAREGKRDRSRCAADLRVALIAEAADTKPGD